MPEKAFIEMGSNIQPERYLPLAVEKLAALAKILRVSNAYQNPAIAPKPQPDYINAAVMLETTMQPLELRHKLRSLEGRLDRVRTQDRYAPRTIDLDLVLFGNMILEHPLLHLPDKHIYDRPHMAVTLAECDPDYLHPQTGEKLSVIAERLFDPDILTLRDDVDLSPALGPSRTETRK